MGKAWHERSPEERRDLQAVFVAIHGAELLLDERSHWDSGQDAGADEAPRRPSFARLHAALHGGEALPADIADALRSDRGFREDFDLLLRRSAVRHLPRAAAAAGHGDVTRREAGGLVLRMVASRAQGGQVYLLVELPEEAAGDGERTTLSRIVVGNAAGEFLKRDLPAAEGGVIRLLMEADDPLARAVGDPATEIFLV